jgi:hypothetical protein
VHAGDGPEGPEVFDDPRTEDEWLLFGAQENSRSPSRWQSQASILKAAGDAVWEDMERHTVALHSYPIGSDPERSHRLLSSDRLFTWAPALMLWGFAIENLLKGLIVAIDEQAVTVEDNLRIRTVWSSRRKGHDLEWLAERAGVAEGRFPQERALLVKLGRYTRWSGRYPFPADYGEQRATTSPDGERQEAGGIDHDDISLFGVLYQRWSERLSEAGRAEGQRRHEREEVEQARLYPIVLAKLETTCMVEPLDNGATAYRSSEPAETDDTHQVACAGCGVSFVIGREVKAVRCRCSHLHIARYRYEPAWGRLAGDAITLRRRPGLAGGPDLAR